MNYKIKLLNKIKKKDIKVGVIGLGYVGLPLSISYCKKGYKTFGFDIDKNKIKSLISGKTYLNTISNIQINKVKKKFFPTNNFNLISDCDVIIICIPTPLKKKFKPDLSYLKNTVNTLFKYIRFGQILSLESTSYPGTTNEEITNKLKKKFIVGNNIFVCYSPEREDPGNKNFKTLSIPKIVSGETKDCLDIGKKFYSAVFKKIVPVSSIATAEFTKLLENIYRSVNIGLVNEMKIIANLMKIDIYEAIEAASSKPFGFKPFQPGPGMGGHCIPIDPFYMSWKAKKLGYDSAFIKNSGLINSVIPKWIVKQILLEFKKKGIIPANKKILIVGVSYKKNIDDTRESPAFEIMNLLKKKKIKIDYHDPLVPKLKKTRKFNFNMSSKKLTKKMIKKYSGVLIVTDHDKINYSLLINNSKLLFDCRGKLRTKYKNQKSKFILL